MHRNVTCHLLRPRPARAPPVRTPITIPHSLPASTKTDPQSTPSITDNTSDADKTRQLLRTLDQSTLREAKATIDAHLARLNNLPAALDPHLPVSVPATLTAKASPSSPSTHLTATSTPYTIAPHTTKHNTLPSLTSAVIAELQRVREHLTDLQHEGYDSTGEGQEDAALGAWQAEVDGMTRAERQLRLENMVLEEEAVYGRLASGAGKNAEAITALLREMEVAVRSREGGRKEEKKKKGKENKEEKKDGKAKGAEDGNKEEQGDDSLMAISKRLNAEMTKGEKKK